MFELIRLDLRFLVRSAAKVRWLWWVLGVSFIVVLSGLIPILRQGADPLVPFGILVLDWIYAAALWVFLLVFVFLSVQVIGIALFRYNGVLLMLAGIGVFEYQIYEFMRSSEWHAFALRDLTDVLFLTLYLDHSTRWTTLKAFLAETPLSLFFIVCGALWHVSAKPILDNALAVLREAENQPLQAVVEAESPTRVPAVPMHVVNWIRPRLIRAHLNMARNRRRVWLPAKVSPPSRADSRTRTHPARH